MVGPHRFAASVFCAQGNYHFKEGQSCLRRFVAPLAEWGSLPNIFPMTSCDFSPDGSMLVTGISVKKGSGSSALTFVSTSSLEKVCAAAIPLMTSPSHVLPSH